MQLTHDYDSQINSGRDAEMNTTLDFLDAVKAKHGINSDYALAPVLGVTRSAVSKYRNKLDYLSDKKALLVASLLEINSGIVLAAVHAEKSKNEQEKAAWVSIWEKLGGVAAGLVVALVLGSAASPIEAKAGQVAHNVYYVKSRRRLNKNPFIAILQPFVPAF